MTFQIQKTFRLIIESCWVYYSIWIIDHYVRYPFDCVVKEVSCENWEPFEDGQNMQYVIRSSMNL